MKKVPKEIIMIPITAVERTVLEILNSKPLDLNEINQKSGFNQNLSLKILRDLIEKNYVNIDNGKFSKNYSLSKEIIKEINNPDFVNSETLEYIEAVVENKNSNMFRFKKIFLTDSENKILNAMLINLELFLKSTQEKRSTSSFSPNKDQRVIFWGSGKVETITKQMIGVYK